MHINENIRFADVVGRVAHQLARASGKNIFSKISCTVVVCGALGRELMLQRGTVCFISSLPNTPLQHHCCNTTVATPLLQCGTLFFINTTVATLLLQCGTVCFISSLPNAPLLQCGTVCFSALSLMRLCCRLVQCVSSVLSSMYRCCSVVQCVSSALSPVHCCCSVVQCVSSAQCGTIYRLYAVQNRDCLQCTSHLSPMSQVT